MSRLLDLGKLVKIHREFKGLSQDQVATECANKTNRSAIAHLEQGLRLPKPDVLISICENLSIPKPLWESFIQPHSLLRFDFENVLQELTGRTLELDSHDETSIESLEVLIHKLFNLNVSPAQLFDLFNSVLVYYGLGPINQWFFTKYYSPSDFGSIDEFKKATDVYQIDAVRLFSTFTEAFDKMSRASISDNILKELNVVDISKYESRGEWELIELINDEHLPDLGYISAKTVRQEHNERRWLRDQLDIIASDLINKIDSSVILESLSTKKKNKIDSLLRKFDSNIAHGLSSPLFLFDSDIIKRESERLAPLGEDILERMEQTQRKALKNLSSYLSSDYMDIYVATSMRTDADYISVNSFVKYLFGDSRVRPLKLRYFNPTQSWIDDRVGFVS
ncbi:helix-turn-helix domain-containing protein [Shewanella baltica]|uniref:helix-turn-helix domain-containing protein n=1 Tax=Shewanella baltica TaxID=62322 RepID=UPI003CFD14B0